MKRALGWYPQVSVTGALLLWVRSGDHGISNFQFNREQYQEYFQLDDKALAARGARRYVADNKAGFPCRVSLIDAEPGEQVILLSYHHQAARTPYAALGPIFVRETAENTVLSPNQVPELLRSRLLSVRAYNSEDLMTEADVVNGLELESRLSHFFADPTVSY